MLPETSVFFRTEDEKLQRVYDAAEEKCRLNLKDFGGDTVLVEGGGYDKIWDALTPTLKDMFVRAFAKGELFNCVEWTVALEEYRNMLSNHEFDDEEVYRVFPYFVAEEEAPAKKSSGKVSVREAIMKSNMNSREAVDSYTRQMPSTQQQAQQTEKPKSTAASPAFKGSSSAPSPKAIKPATNTASQASALASHMNSASQSFASQKGSAPQSSMMQDKSSGKGLLGKILLGIFVVLVLGAVAYLAILMS